MPLRKVPVDDLKVGMKFSKAVFIDPYNILVGPNEPITSDHLLKLKDLGIEAVETAGEVVDPGGDVNVSEQRERSALDIASSRYLRLHELAVKGITAVFTNYKTTGEFDTARVQEIVDKLITEINSEKNLNIFINLVNIAEGGEYLYSHSVNVCILALLMGKKLGYSAIRLKNLGLGAILHDVGMLKIPAYIVEKEGKLSAEEYNIIKTHTIHGYKIIRDEAKLLNEIALVALEHHEKFDGSGYPRRLKGNDISEMARIVAIVDTYEALTKKRSYRDKKIFYEAMKTVLSEGSLKFDRQLLRTFLGMMSIYPVGSLVKLSNNTIARVVASDPVTPFRPTVKVIYDEFGDRVEDGELIKLSTEPDIYIVKAVDERELVSNGV